MIASAEIGSLRQVGGRLIREVPVVLRPTSGSGRGDERLPEGGFEVSEGDEDDGEVVERGVRHAFVQQVVGHLAGGLVNVSRDRLGLDCVPGEGDGFLAGEHVEHSVAC